MAFLATKIKPLVTTYVSNNQNLQKEVYFYMWLSFRVYKYRYYRDSRKLLKTS